MKQYQFTQFKDFFEHQLRENTYDGKGKKITTLQALAQKMGYKSASLLSMVAKGHRLPSKSLMEALFNEWKIDKKNRDLLKLRVEIEKKLLKGKNTFTLLDKLSKMAPKNQYKLIDLDQFNLIREWYMMVLRVLVDTPSFQEDPAIISQRLRRKVTPSQVQKGLELLQKVKLIERDPQTGKLRTTCDSTETTQDVPSEAIREHHKGMLHKAIEAIDEQKIHERQFNALTFKMDPKRMAAAKEKLTNFVKQFNEEFDTNSTNSVYQLNIQLFEQTKNEESELS